MKETVKEIKERNTMKQLENRMKQLKKTVATLQRQLIDMRDELKYTSTEEDDSPTVNDENNKRVLKESLITNEETLNKA